MVNETIAANGRISESSESFKFTPNLKRSFGSFDIVEYDQLEHVKLNQRRTYRHIVRVVVGIDYVDRRCFQCLRVRVDALQT